MGIFGYANIRASISISGYSNIELRDPPGNDYHSQMTLVRK